MLEGKTLREVCISTGVSRRAIQGYEKAGLVKAAGKNKYGYLLYDADGENRIRLIRFYQALGFSIREICELVDAPNKRKKEALQLKRKQMEVKCRDMEKLILKLDQYIESL